MDQPRQLNAGQGGALSEKSASTTTSSISDAAHTERDAVREPASESMAPQEPAQTVPVRIAQHPQSHHRPRWYWPSSVLVRVLILLSLASLIVMVALLATLCGGHGCAVGMGTTSSSSSSSDSGSGSGSGSGESTVPGSGGGLKSSR